jgi:hypothetical protein
MSYNPGDCTCNWCGCNVSKQRSDSIACNDCYETLESENATLKARIAELEAQI